MKINKKELGQTFWGGSELKGSTIGPPTTVPTTWIHAAQILL